MSSVARIRISLLLLITILYKCNSLALVPELKKNCSSFIDCSDSFKKDYSNLTSSSLFMILQHKYNSINKKYLFTLHEFKNVLNSDVRTFIHANMNNEIENVGSANGFITNVIRAESGAQYDLTRNVYINENSHDLFTTCRGNIFSCQQSKLTDDSYTYFKTILDTTAFSSYFKAGETSYIANDTTKYSFVYPSKPHDSDQLSETFPWTMANLTKKGVATRTGDGRLLFVHLTKTKSGMSGCNYNEVIVSINYRPENSSNCRYDQLSTNMKEYPKMHVFYNKATGLGCGPNCSDKDNTIKIHHATFGLRFKDMNGVKDVIDAYVLFPKKPTTTIPLPTMIKNAQKHTTVAPYDASPTFRFQRSACNNIFYQSLLIVYTFLIFAFILI